MIVQATKVKKDIIMGENTLSILKEVNLIVNPGETISILGVSGSGKSTLLALLAGLDDPTQGSIALLGQELSSLNQEQRAQMRQAQISFVFQSFHLLPHLNALENVMLPCEIAGMTGVEQAARALLDKVGLGQRHHHYPRQLSGGEMQRVALARAFVTKPSLIFADEPTGSLDEKTALQIIDMLYEMNEQANTTLVMVTHDPKVANRSQQSYQLEHGVLNQL